MRIAASWDSGSYSSNVVPGGFWIVNAQQSIFYWNPIAGYTQVPGAASALAPTTNGGLFALGVPNTANGNPIYYDDLSTGTWAQQPGAGIAIATNSSNVYVIGAAGGIYQAPITVAVPSPSASPSATPSPTPSPTATPTLSPLVFNPPMSLELTQSPLACPTPLPAGNICVPTANIYNFVQASQVGGYAGPFTATSQDPNIAVQETCPPNTFPPPTMTCAGGLSTISFQGFRAGSTAVTIAGANNITAPYTVYVTLTTVRVHIRNLPTAYSISWSTSNFGNPGGNTNTYGSNGTAVLPQPANGSDFNILNPSLPGSLPGSITVTVSDGARTIATSTVGGSGTSVPPFIIDRQNFVDVTPQ